MDLDGSPFDMDDGSPFDMDELKLVGEDDKSIGCASDVGVSLVEESEFEVSSYTIGMWWGSSNG